MRINYNVSAMITNNALTNSDNRVAKSLQRLSTGLKINAAKDNPAGLAMGNRMNAQLEGVKQAGHNASDGISILETADGALGEVAEMLQRMNELAVKASNGTMTDDDRRIIDDEVQELKKEIQRVSETTEFNGQKLLNGEFSSKGYTDHSDIKVTYYSEQVSAPGAYTIQSLPLKENAATGMLELNGGVVFGPEFPTGTKAELTDNMLHITNLDGFELKLDLDQVEMSSYANNLLKIDIAGIGAMRLQTGANEGQVTSIDIPSTGVRNLGISYTNVKTKEDAEQAIDSIKSGLSVLSTIRGRLGAYQNRLESTVNSLDVTDESMTSAYSRIMDVDMAEEMTEYTTNQVITQAATSMLAQANERPSQVLQLLQ